MSRREPMKPASFDIHTADGRLAMVSASPHPPTIDGRPARVGGYGRDFALVTDKRSGATLEFSWPTVELIMHLRDGKFRS